MRPRWAAQGRGAGATEHRSGPAPVSGRCRVATNRGHALSTAKPGAPAVLSVRRGQGSQTGHRPHDYRRGADGIRSPRMPKIVRTEWTCSGATRSLANIPPPTGRRWMEDASHHPDRASKNDHSVRSAEHAVHIVGLRGPRDALLPHAPALDIRLEESHSPVRLKRLRTKAPVACIDSSRGGAFRRHAVPQVGTNRGSGRVSPLCDSRRVSHGGTDH